MRNAEIEAKTIAEAWEEFRPVILSADPSKLEKEISEAREMFYCGAMVMNTLMNEIIDQIEMGMIAPMDLSTVGQLDKLTAEIDEYMKQRTGKLKSALEDLQNAFSRHDASQK